MVLVLLGAGGGGLTARPGPPLREPNATCNVVAPRRKSTLRRKSSPARALISASGEQPFLSAAVRV